MRKFISVILCALCLLFSVCLAETAPDPVPSPIGPLVPFAFSDYTILVPADWTLADLLDDETENYTFFGNIKLPIAYGCLLIYVHPFESDVLDDLGLSMVYAEFLMNKKDVTPYSIDVDGRRAVQWHGIMSAGSTGDVLTDGFLFLDGHRLIEIIYINPQLSEQANFDTMCFIVDSFALCGPDEVTP